MIRSTINVALRQIIYPLVVHEQLLRQPTYSPTCCATATISCVVSFSRMNRSTIDVVLRQMIYLFKCPLVSIQSVVPSIHFFSANS